MRADKREEIRKECSEGKGKEEKRKDKREENRPNFFSIFNYKFFSIFFNYKL